MSAALRTTQSTPSMRPLGAAFGGIVVAAAIVGLVAFGQQAMAKPQAPSVAVSAPVLHDRGLATAPSVAVSAPVLHDRGLATAPSVAVSAPVLHDRGLATAPSVAASAPVLHDRGLATAPSVASGDSPSRSSGGSNGTRFRQ